MNISPHGLAIGVLYMIRNFVYDLCILYMIGDFDIYVKNRGVFDIYLKFCKIQNYYTHIIFLYICINYGYILYTIRIFMVYLFTNIFYYSCLLLIFIYLQKIIAYAISIQNPLMGKFCPLAFF